jgi:hypothetical protein
MNKAKIAKRAKVITRINQDQNLMEVINKSYPSKVCLGMKWSKKLSDKIVKNYVARCKKRENVKNRRIKVAEENDRWLCQ